MISLDRALASFVVVSEKKTSRLKIGANFDCEFSFNLNEKN